MTLTLRNVVEWHVALSLALGLASLVSGVGDVGSLWLGAAWALANLAIWAAIVRTLVRARQGGVITKRARLVTAAAVVGKFGLFLVLGAAMFLKFPVEPLSLAVGVTVLTLALLTSALTNSRRLVWREA